MNSTSILKTRLGKTKCALELWPATAGELRVCLTDASSLKLESSMQQSLGPAHCCPGSEVITDTYYFRPASPIPDCTRWEKLSISANNLSCLQSTVILTDLVQSGLSLSPPLRTTRGNTLTLWQQWKKRGGLKRRKRRTEGKWKGRARETQTEGDSQKKSQRQAQSKKEKGTERGKKQHVRKISRQENRRVRRRVRLERNMRPRILLTSKFPPWKTKYPVIKGLLCERSVVSQISFAPLPG